MAESFRQSYGSKILKGVTLITFLRGKYLKLHLLASTKLVFKNVVDKHNTSNWEIGLDYISFDWRQGLKQGFRIMSVIWEVMGERESGMGEKRKPGKGYQWVDWCYAQLGAVPWKVKRAAGFLHTSSHGWGLLLGVNSLAILTPPLSVQSETQDASALGELPKGNGGDASGTPKAFLQTLNQKNLTVESHNKYPFNKYWLLGSRCLDTSMNKKDVDTAFVEYKYQEEKEAHNIYDKYMTYT